MLEIKFIFIPRFIHKKYFLKFEFSVHRRWESFLSCQFPKNSSIKHGIAFSRVRIEKIFLSKNASWHFFHRSASYRFISSANVRVHSMAFLFEKKMQKKILVFNFWKKSSTCLGRGQIFYEKKKSVSKIREKWTSKIFKRKKSEIFFLSICIYLEENAGRKFSFSTNCKLYYVIPCTRTRRHKKWSLTLLYARREMLKFFRRNMTLTFQFAHKRYHLCLYI